MTKSFIQLCSPSSSLQKTLLVQHLQNHHICVQTQTSIIFKYTAQLEDFQTFNNYLLNKLCPRLCLGPARHGKDNPEAVIATFAKKIMTNLSKTVKSQVLRTHFS